MSIRPNKKIEESIFPQLLFRLNTDKNNVSTECAMQRDRWNPSPSLYPTQVNLPSTLVMKQHSPPHLVITVWHNQATWHTQVWTPISCCPLLPFVTSGHHIVLPYTVLQLLALHPMQEFTGVHQGKGLGQMSRASLEIINMPPNCLTTF